MLFIGIVLLLVFLPVICGQMSTQYVKRRVEHDKLLYEYQWRFEIYLSQVLNISVPTNSNNASISLTHFDLFGNKFIEEEEFTSKSMLIRLNSGRHIFNLKFSVPRNATTDYINLHPTFEANIFVDPFSQEKWMLLSLICSVAFVLVALKFPKQGIITNQIVRSYKSLTSLIEQFQNEIKTLNHENVDDIRNSYSNALPNIKQLRTIRDIEAFMNEHKQILGDPQEKRAALILQAILNLSNEIKEIASRYQPSIALSLEQMLDKNLISSVYRPRVDDLLQTSQDLKYASRAKSALDYAQQMMETENVYLKTAKIVGTFAVVLLAMVILGFQPANFLILKLPLFFYMLSNLLGFVVRLI